MDKTCRICLDNEDQNLMISPCRCNGSMQFVHTSCLNEWRSQSYNSDKCTICNQYYTIRYERKLSTFECIVIVMLPIMYAICMWIYIIRLIIVRINRIIL